MKPAARSVPILLYHNIEESPAGWIAPWTCEPAQFEDHLTRIVDMGFKPVSLNDLIRSRAGTTALPEHPIVITFDDGFANFATEAAPRMLKRSIPCTMYMTTGVLHGGSDWRLNFPRSNMLSISQLAELDEAGIEVGAHSESHPQLDIIPIERARSEIVASKEILEQILQHPVKSFAYPHGYSTAKIRSVVSSSGFSSACAVGNTLSCERDAVYSIARLTVKRDTTPERLLDWLAGHSANRASASRHTVALAWRCFRWASTQSRIRSGRTARTVMP